jgi:hypothetical protein
MMDLQGTIAKVDMKHRLVFGWAYISKDADGTVVVDSQDDFVSDDWQLEKAAYEYVVKSRNGSDTHLVKGVATLVESMVMTPEKAKAMGLQEDVPTGWWVGMRITSDEMLQKVQSGEYTSFSIGGKGLRKRKETPERHRRLI